MPWRWRRNWSATTCAAVTGSSGWLITASASDQLASQPLGTRHENDDRRAVVDLVLELPGESHAAGRLSLTVDYREIKAADGPSASTSSALVAHSSQSMRGEIRSRPAADSGTHLRPNIGRNCCNSSTMTVSVAGALMRRIVSACWPAAAPGSDVVASVRDTSDPAAPNPLGRDIMRW